MKRSMLKTYNQKIVASVIGFTAILAVAMFGLSKIVLADDCGGPYGGGTCTEGYRIKKEVKKLEESDSAYSKVTKDVKKGHQVVFKITVKNVGEVDGRDLVAEDTLPNELVLVDGDLSKDIHDLDEGESTDYTIKAYVKDSEYQAGVSKCVVNVVKLKADLNDDGHKETIGSDAATVCYGTTVSELPKTGAADTIAFTLVGLGLIVVGRGVKRFA